MVRSFVVTLLASGALVLGIAASAAAQGAPPEGVVGGVYDSFGRTKDEYNRVPLLDRVVEIAPNGLGGLRYVVRNRRGQLLGSALLVPKCKVTYDGRLATYFQNFETVPARKGDPAEKVSFYFRINDPIGDYDVYFQTPGGPLRSEILKLRGR
jgi:hypothetical protein